MDRFKGSEGVEGRVHQSGHVEEWLRKLGTGMREWLETRAKLIESLNINITSSHLTLV